MVNYGAKILNTASGALSAHQALISVLSNNIANVNTPGYVRRSVSLEARGGPSQGAGDFGHGVAVGPLQRSVDGYLDKLLREAGADKSSFEAQEGLLSRVDQLFDLTGSNSTIGKSFTEFFSAISDLRANPSSIELRSGLLNKAESLVSSIRDTFNGISSVQDEADGRMTGEVAQINSFLDDIARLNGVISNQENGGIIAGDERDQRDELIRKVTEKVGASFIEQSDGSAYLSLPGGFPLVSGTTARHLKVTEDPSFTTQVPPLLSGRPGRYIVYDYAQGKTPSQDVDLSEVIRSAGGTLGGLLTVRGTNSPNSTSPFSGTGPLVAAASRVESMARVLLTRFNQVYRGPDEDGVTAGLQPSSVDLNGNTPSAFGFFNAQLAGSSILTDNDGDGLAELSDLAATGQHTFADKLSLAISDPRAIAAARDVDTNPNSVVLAPGNADNLVALSALRTEKVQLGVVGNPQDVSVPSTASMTFEEGYQELLTQFGGTFSSVQFGSKNAEARFVLAQQRRDQQSGVNLDEEFTQLIKFQQAYQASSRLVRSASEILDTVIGLL
jgi:flagellar hook-associated protein 1 FlgK